MNDDLNTLHTQLFPEEYDFMYDSSLDAKERAQGINPMSQDYINRVNARRATIGIAPYTVTEDAPGNLSTKAWIEERLASDRHDEIEKYRLLVQGE